MLYAVFNSRTLLKNYCSQLTFFFNDKCLVDEILVSLRLISPFWDLYKDYLGRKILQTS